MPTVLPFHRAVVADPAFAGRTSRSRCTPAGSRPSSTTRSRRTPATGRRGRASRRSGSGHRRGRRQAARGGPARRPRRGAGGPAARAGGPAAARRRRREGGGRPRAGGDALVSPMQGTIVKVAVERGAAGGRAGDLDRGARGDEDGAAAHRPQGRHRHRACPPRWARPSPPARRSASSRTDHREQAAGGPGPGTAGAVRARRPAAGPEPGLGPARADRRRLARQAHRPPRDRDGAGLRGAGAAARARCGSASWWPGLFLLCSVGIVALYADDIRVSRLRRHGLEAPDDPTWGAPRIEGARARPVRDSILEFHQPAGRLGDASRTATGRP